MKKQYPFALRAKRVMFGIWSFRASSCINS